MVTGSDPETARVVDAEYAGARTAGRTALTKAEWAEGLHAQVAVAWVLGCVFVRFCEDNGLVSDPLLAGPGGRRAIALDHRTAYVHANPAHDDRHWLREVFRQYRALPATGEIFGEHNPVWLLAPSADGARSLVQAFQAVDPEKGEVRHDFADPAWDTRFLGDLYQDLSEQAKKTYALLQTPEFVEEFILDRTLEPALATFGLREVTLIDPTCGSGHFLLGAFARLFERWGNDEPDTNPRELARRALNAIAGVDLNPFAAAIARFRLLAAALRASGDTRLADAPAYPIQVAVGDSLLHGDPPGRLAGTSVEDEIAGAAAHGYSTEDIEDARALLSRPWHAVVGNPPYITVKDPALNALYRARFKTCHRQYSLGVPFTECFFQLARYDSRNLERAGFVGMITANSFMKREFGKKLVQEWGPTHDLTHVIDTSGAEIPGHKTPTVILFGRNRPPVAAAVRVVMGIRGEYPRPSDPEKGLVWSSVVALVDEPGSVSEYVSVVDLPRTRLAKHPWSIGGGGASELKELLELHGRKHLGSMIEAIGRTSVVGEDDAWVMPNHPTAERAGVNDATVPFVTGDAVRDWILSNVALCVYPYESLTGDPLPSDDIVVQRFLWQNRTTLRNRTVFSKTFDERGLPWWCHLERYVDKLRTPLSIVFAFVATHNHFVLDHGGKVFKQSAPVIKLSAGADERDHLKLLGVLNSSTACFWMKQVFFDKGKMSSGTGGVVDEAWERFFEHDATKLAALPLPSDLDSATACLLDRLAGDLAAVTPAAVAAFAAPTAARLAEAKARYQDLRARMIAAQERLDWEVYRRYGTVDHDLTTGDDPEPPLQLGERAFEIVLARKMAAGDEETSWFARHGSTPVTELPAHWPVRYRTLV